MDKAVKFYEEFLGIKATHREGNRWADFEIEGQEGMYFGLIDEKALGEKRIIGNNATLGIYTDDINTAFERAKKMEATILYEPTYVQDSPYKYICFGMLDLDGNMLEIANYVRQEKEKIQLEEDGGGASETEISQNKLYRWYRNGRNII